MAANFWVSSQRKHWSMTREKLVETLTKLDDEDRAVVQQFPLPDRRGLSIFFNIQIGRLGRKLQIRQQAIATAQVYVRRFYTKIPIRRTNPYLVMATAVYLACKMEECAQHIRHVCSEARGVWPEFITNDTAKLGECEFRLISELNSNLIVHHPYRTLSAIRGPLEMTTDEVQVAWGVINDSYMTDLLFFYSPHVIALAAVVMAVGLKGPSGIAVPAEAGSPSRVERMMNWFAASEVDMEGVIDCTQEVLSLYEVWESFQEKPCREQIGLFIKGRVLDW